MGSSWIVADVCGNGRTSLVLISPKPQAVHSNVFDAESQRIFRLPKELDSCKLTWSQSSKNMQDVDLHWVAAPSSKSRGPGNLVRMIQSSHNRVFLVRANLKWNRTHVSWESAGHVKKLGLSEE